LARRNCANRACIAIDREHARPRGGECAPRRSIVARSVCVDSQVFSSIERVDGVREPRRHDCTAAASPVVAGKESPK
jgi:hypothetical protein